MSFRVVQHEPRTLRWWYEQHLAGLLDLKPKFQRRSELWSRFKQAHLIDSIINDFDIPKLYIADFTLARSALNEAKKPYAVVDGKQRFEAIFGFLECAFPLNASALVDSEPNSLVKGLDFKGLEKAYPHIAEKIENYRPVVMSIATDEEDKIYEMFVRLNSGEAANSAERRNAKPGPVPQLVREIAAHPFFTNRVRFNRKRMQEFGLAAKLLLIEHRGAFVDTKAGQLDRLVLDAAAEVGDGRSPEQEEVLRGYIEIKDRVISNLELMADAFDPNDALLASAGQIPVYYWVVRNHPEVVDNFRDFLTRFTKRVLASVRNAKIGDGPVEERMLTYYTHSRTTNDQQSLRGRYDILCAELTRAHLILQP